MQNRLEASRAALSNEKDTLVKHREELDVLKKSWLSTLQREVAGVNEKISKYFGSIRCRGETRVIAPETEMNYSDYKLDIKVAFRPNQPLESLAVGRQSGGTTLTSFFCFIKIYQVSDQWRQCFSFWRCQPHDVLFALSMR